MGQKAKGGKSASGGVLVSTAGMQLVQSIYIAVTEQQIETRMQRIQAGAREKKWKYVT